MNLIEGKLEFFRSGKTLPEEFRRSCLLKLRACIIEKENKILDALRLDLAKNPIEAYTSEILFVLSEIKHALKNISAWIKPQTVKTPLFLKPGKSIIYPEPKGTALIIGPWNYPFQLVLAPLVGAIAAGSCVVIKPSEFAPNTAGVIDEVIKSCFQPEHCSVVQGGGDTSKELCSLPWGHLFFTGSPRAGRLVMEEAAKNLTPVTLELGGKSPCLVLDDADIPVTAERIVWGKYLNAGQTCVAPDIVYAHKNITGILLREIQLCISKFFGQNPEKSPDYGRIINREHTKRLAGYLNNTQIVTGGKFDLDTRYFAPTVVLNPPEKSPLLDQEIFGPILPVVEFDSLENTINVLNLKPIPLSLYIFTRSDAAKKFILKSLPSGTASINDTIKQAASAYMPFGGLGESGMGAYHGKATFDCFTHYRSVFDGAYNGFKFHYPPYKVKLSFLKRFLKFFI